MDLPSMQSVFDFEFTSDLGIKREGRFTVLCVLNMRQKHQLELEKTRLLGNYSNPTDELSGIAIVLGNLRSKIIDAPDWWKQSNGGYDLLDVDTLMALNAKIQAAEVEWRTKLKEKAQKLPEPAPSPQSSNA